MNSIVKKFLHYKPYYLYKIKNFHLIVNSIREYHENPKIFALDSIGSSYRISCTLVIIFYPFNCKENYLKPIEACQTKANNRKNTGITGATSIIGLKTAYASGNLANNKFSAIFV